MHGTLLQQWYKQIASLQQDGKFSCWNDALHTAGITGAGTLLVHLISQVCTQSNWHCLENFHQFIGHHERIFR